METASELTIYLQFEQNVAIHNRSVRLRDAAKIYCSDKEAADRAGNLVIARLNNNESQRVMSAIEVIKLICRHYPNASVTVLGENDFILSMASGKKHSVAAEYIRTGIVSLIAFFGAAFSVATFNNDVDVSFLFDQVLVTMRVKDSLLPWLQVSYSFGIPIGILIFYNHIAKRDMYNDPTPLEVEMRLYEQETNMASILNENRKGEEDVHK